MNYCSCRLDLEKNGGALMSHAQPMCQPQSRHAGALEKWAQRVGITKVGLIGIRRLNELNEVILTKLAWRIVTNPPSLLARIMRAKYDREYR